MVKSKHRKYKLWEEDGVGYYTHDYSIWNLFNPRGSGFVKINKGKNFQDDVNFDILTSITEENEFVIIIRPSEKWGYIKKYYIREEDTVSPVFPVNPT